MPDKMVVKWETNELSILVRPTLHNTRFCQGCRADVRWVTPDEAMLLLGTTVREVFRLVERGDLHFSENGDGFGLICVRSMSADLDIEKLNKGDYDDE